MRSEEIFGFCQRARLARKEGLPLHLHDRPRGVKEGQQEVGGVAPRGKFQLEGLVLDRPNSRKKRSNVHKIPLRCRLRFNGFGLQVRQVYQPDRAARRARHHLACGGFHVFSRQKIPQPSGFDGFFIDRREMLEETTCAMLIIFSTPAGRSRE